MVASEADDAILLATSYGLTPDPWQRDVLASWMGTTADGQWAAKICGLCVPRQNGKNGALEVYELFVMVFLGMKVLHTAHEVKTARKAFRRLKHFFGAKVNDPLAKFPELNALVAELRETNGQEAIFLHNGGQIEFVARSKGSARGFTVDVRIFDEAQELSDAAIEALGPTSSAAPSGNPHTIYTGTSPSPKMVSEVWQRIRKAGHDPSNQRMSWKEWGCEDPGDDPERRRALRDDREAWAFANPALGYRLAEQTIVDQDLIELSVDGFLRERLGVWDAQLAAGPDGASFDVDRWDELEDDDPDNAPEQVRIFGIEVRADRSAAAIGAAGVRDDGVVYVEFLESVPVDQLVDACLELDEAQGPASFGIAAGGPAKSLVTALQDAGVDVTTLNTDDVVAACDGMVDAINAGAVAHGPQDDLRDSVEGARNRNVGDGRRAVSRRTSVTDSAPVLSVIIARWLALELDYDLDESIY